MFFFFFHGPIMLDVFYECQPLPLCPYTAGLHRFAPHPAPRLSRCVRATPLYYITDNQSRGRKKKFAERNYYGSPHGIPQSTQPGFTSHPVPPPVSSPSAIHPFTSSARILIDQAALICTASTWLIKRKTE